MVQQLWSEIEKLKAEIRRLRGQMQAISSGGQILPTSVITTGGTVLSNNYYKWKNTTGSTKLAGTVIREIEANQNFGVPNADDAVDIVGILTEDTINNAYGVVRSLGFQPTVLVSGNVVVGDYLAAYGATPGYSYDTGVPVGDPVSPGMFAIALSAFTISSGNPTGIVSAYVFPVVLSSVGFSSAYIPFGSGQEVFSP